MEERFQRKDRRAVVNIESLERGTEGVIALSGGYPVKFPSSSPGRQESCQKGSRTPSRVVRVRSLFGDPPCSFGGARGSAPPVEGTRR